MRTNASQPRKGTPGSKGGGGRGKSGGNVRGSTVGAVLRGLSGGMGLGDMAKWAADKAEQAARSAAEAAGKTAKQAARAARHARAESIKDTAARAGVSDVTARRWARGAQKPAAETEKEARPKVQRHLGGARAIRAERMAGLSGMSPGSVTVRIKSGPMAGQTETRNIGHVGVSRSTAAEVAELIEAGEDDEAAALLGDALLEAYGDGLSDFMEIIEFGGSPEMFF